MSADTERTSLYEDVSNWFTDSHFTSVLMDKGIIMPSLPGYGHPLLQTRFSHSVRAAHFGKTTGKLLGLNAELLHAAMLIHDVGHVPLGHFGESILGRILQSMGYGKFAHNVQSLRVVEEIDPILKDGRTLPLELREAVLMHRGVKYENPITPCPPCSEEKIQHYTGVMHGVHKPLDGDPYLYPSTMEGALIRFIDAIDCLALNVNEALRLGLLTEKNSLPSVHRF